MGRNTTCKSSTEAIALLTSNINLIEQWLLTNIRSLKFSDLRITDDHGVLIIEHSISSDIFRNGLIVQIYMHALQKLTRKHSLWFFNHKDGQFSAKIDYDIVIDKIHDLTSIEVICKEAVKFELLYSEKRVKHVQREIDKKNKELQDSQQALSVIQRDIDLLCSLEQ